jgi:hypothetical protein
MIDWTKPLQMRDGTPVVFRFRLDNKYKSRVCTYRDSEGVEQLIDYMDNGQLRGDGQETTLDLKNVEEE